MNGARNAFHKNQFTEAERDKMRRLLRDNPEMTKTTLAKRFGVSVGSIDRLLNRWYHNKPTVALQKARIIVCGERTNHADSGSGVCLCTHAMY